MSYFSPNLGFNFSGWPYSKTRCPFRVSRYISDSLTLHSSHIWICKRRARVSFSDWSEVSFALTGSETVQDPRAEAEAIICTQACLITELMHFYYLSLPQENITSLIGREYISFLMTNLRKKRSPNKTWLVFQNLSSTLAGGIPLHLGFASVYPPSSCSRINSVKGGSGLCPRLGTSGTKITTYPFIDSEITDFHIYVLDACILFLWLP